MITIAKDEMLVILEEIYHPVLKLLHSEFPDPEACRWPHVPISAERSSDSSAADHVWRAENLQNMYKRSRRPETAPQQQHTERIKRTVPPPAASLQNPATS